jgi:hypothetical protein
MKQITKNRHIITDTKRSRYAIISEEIISLIYWKPEKPTKDRSPISL